MSFKTFLKISVLLTAVFVFGVKNTALATDNSALIAQIQAQIAQLTLQVQQMLAQQQVGATWCHNFNSNIGFSSSGSGEVSYLHTALQNQMISYSPDSTYIYSYGTAEAVKQFQARYSIYPQSGYVGPLTRAKLNMLYGCQTGVVPNPTPTPNPTPSQVNGVCGTAMRTYAQSETFPGSYTLCASGTANTNPYLSSSGGSTATWTCNGSGGGQASTTCTATRTGSTTPSGGGSGTTWPATQQNSGNAACAALGKTCAGAYNSTGALSACQTVNYGGTALCSN